jgi:hypothetical protein
VFIQGGPKVGTQYIVYSIVLLYTYFWPTLYYLLVFYMLKLQTINYVLWMVMTRLKSAKYLRCAYVDVGIENILLS